MGEGNHRKWTFVCLHTGETSGGRRIVIEDSNPVDDSTPGKLEF